MNNPQRGKGNRNLWCQYYSACLDIAVEGDWESFHCEKCLHLHSKNQNQIQSFNNSGEIKLLKTLKTPQLEKMPEDQRLFYEAVRYNQDRLRFDGSVFARIDGKIFRQKFYCGFPMNTTKPGQVEKIIKTLDLLEEKRSISIQTSLSLVLYLFKIRFGNNSNL